MMSPRRILFGVVAALSVVVPCARAQDGVTEKTEKVVDRAPAPRPQDGAVAKGLVWLAIQQKTDGSWPGKNNIETTGLGLLAFLGAGENHKGGMPPRDVRRYSKNVEMAVKFLAAKAGAKGAFDAEDLVGNAVAAKAICEAYAQTADPAIKGFAQRSVNFIVDAQHEKGGWGGKPGEEGTMTSTAANLAALKTAQIAGLQVPAKTLKSVVEFLDGVAAKEGSQYAEKAGAKPTLTATARGLLCRQYLGWGPRNPGLFAGVEYLLKEAAPKDLSDPTTTLFVSQVMRHSSAEKAEKWSRPVREFLMKAQDSGSKKGADKGSWAPADADDAARFQTTVLCLLTLEVDYGHLYRRTLGGDR